MGRGAPAVPRPDAPALPTGDARRLRDLAAASRMSGSTVRRCAWAEGTEPLMLSYHDEEWGMPTHDERRLFEMLTLEGAQAGLSWSTILNKREGYRRAFRGFDPEAVARLSKRDVDRLLKAPGIVRNRSKVESTVGNARAVVDLDGSLDELLWSFVDGSPIVGRRRTMQDI